MEKQTTIPAQRDEPAWLDEPCPGDRPWDLCMADECTCSRPALVLTCLTCGRAREHPVGERVSFECANPDCGGWVLTARLVDPADLDCAAELGAAGAAERRVGEFLAVHAENRSADLIATEHYHDGMGHAIAVLRADDLREVVRPTRCGSASAARDPVSL